MFDDFTKYLQCTIQHVYDTVYRDIAQQSQFSCLYVHTYCIKYHSCKSVTNMNDNCPMPMLCDSLQT